MAARTRTLWSTTGSASIVVLRPMLAYARARGVDADEILRGIGVPPTAIDEFDRRIPESMRARAWLEAAERSGDPAFGLHSAEYAPMGSLDVLDYALRFSVTLWHGLDRIIRFHRVLCDAWATAAVASDGVVRIRRLERTPPPEAEAASAFLVLRARELTGAPVVPREVRFAHRSPDDTSVHAALFRCPVRFACRAPELVLDEQVLGLPVQTADADVGRVLDRYMTDLLGRLPKSASIVDRVGASVAEAVGRCERPTLAATARELHSSGRTLQRRLLEHGVTYSEIVDAVRNELAVPLIRERRLSVTEVAFMTGFTDVSAFARRYKQWTGLSPSRDRSGH